MKTRVIHTKIWRDNWFIGLSANSQRLFIYVLTNEYVNQIGIYELPDTYIKMTLGLNEPQLDASKKELEPKIKFAKGWVKIKNAGEYQQYSGSINERVQEEELKCIPPDVLDTLSIPYRYPIDSLNNKQSIINNKKSIIKNQKSKETEYQNWLEMFNEIYGTKYRTKSLIRNYEFWRETYSAEEMEEAIKRLASHDWLKDKAKPELVLRRTDTHNNPVDRIGELLSIPHNRIKKIAKDDLAEISEKIRERSQ